jgi:hypothetical protein
VIHVIDQVLLPPEREPASDGRTAEAILVRAIERGVPLFNAGDHQGCAHVYETAARMVLRLPEEKLSTMNRQYLHEVLGAASQEHDAGRRAWSLRHVFDRVLSNLKFKPLMEAPLPEGFPEPGPLGQVIVKSYPRYRAARASGEGSGSFWTLFRHIKKHDVKMTTPVEMTMNDSLRETQMAFLYEQPEQGQAGTDGRVRVLDLEPMTVLSIGMRGPRSADDMARAKAVIEARLASEGWERAGAWRLMGYNSPMVKASKRFWELQLPVTR